MNQLTLKQHTTLLRLANVKKQWNEKLYSWWYVNEVTKRWEVNSFFVLLSVKIKLIKSNVSMCKACSLKVKINQKEFPCKKTRRGWWFRHGYESLEKCACFFGLCALQTISSYFFKHISWLNDLENVGISLVFTHFFSSLYQFDNFSHIYITFLCITCINSSIKFQLIIIYIDCLCLCRRWKRNVKICANVSSRLDDYFWGYELLDFSTPFAQNTAQISWAAPQFLKTSVILSRIKKLLKQIL